MLDAPLPIRVLLLEDDADDAELEIRQLRREKLTCEIRRVDTRDGFVAALDDFRPQVVLADYKLPGFDGREALVLARQRHPEIPVIMVSGTLGDERAVDLIHLGARDFVLKEHLVRLGPAVRSALADAAEHARREQAERALQESEARYRNLIESTSDIVAVAGIDGVVKYASPSVRQMGYEPAALIGRQYLDLVHAEDREIARRGLAELIRQPDVLRRLELRYYRADGTVVWVESVTRNLLGVPGIDGIFGTMRDVTERKRLTAQVEASEARLRQIVENATNLFYSHTPQHVLTYLSPQTRAYLDCEPEEAMVRWTEFLTDDPGNQRGLELTQKAIVTGERQPPYEIELAGKRGRKVWVQVNEAPVVEGGKTVAIVGALTDVTERHAGEAARVAALLRAEAHLGVLAEVTADPALNAGELEVLSRRVTESASAAAQVERVNVWLFNEDETELRCIDAYEATPAAHAAGMLLKEAQFRNEFEALKGSAYVDADNPYTDARTAGYVDGYVRPLGITAMLDAVIRTSGRNIGLLCFEHVGRPHHWEQDEIAFACQLADKLGLCIANRARRASEDRFRAVFAQAAVGIARTAVDGRFIEVNDAYAAIVGYSPAELIGRTFASLTHPDDRERDLAHLQALLSGAEPSYATEKRYVRKDGTLAWAHVTAAPVRTPEGAAAYVVAVVQDISARKQAQGQVERAMEATVRAIGSTVELRDRYTAGHQDRVALLCGEIARLLGLPAGRVHGLTLAASIHDVGKINVPAEILAKPGRLTPAEFALVKEHAEAGAQILKDVELPWPVAEIIRQHHERLDGSGYPRGLKGDAIILEARIVGVADVVEAISAHRPYRAALGMDVALAEIEKHRGTLYDATVVDACLKLFRQEGYRLPG